MEKRPFNELGLSEATLKAVAKLGFEEASPIQTAAIPVLLSGKDLVGQSQTGSGKTAAFVIPALEKLDENQRAPQVLILCPARELAMQVADEVGRLAAFMPKVHAVPIFGGASYERQFYELKRGPQIVIGTPGRIMDHMDRRTLDLTKIRMVILDECDRMLDMGFREDMEHILAVMSPERQTVFFSATMPAAIRTLIEKFSNKPEHVRIASKEMTVPTVDQAFYEVPARMKADALTRILDVQNIRLGIIFCNTQRTVDELTDTLQARGYAADRLHGGLSQQVRTRTIEKFRKSGFDLLVATDVAGRGLDVEELDLVVNFDLPWDPEDYVHRIGRTGRAGRKGLAVTMVSGREIYKLQAIERFTRLRMRRGTVPTMDEVEQKRAGEVVDKVRERLLSGRFKPQDALVERLLEEGHSSTDVASALFHELLAASGFEPDTSRAASERPAAPPKEKPKPVKPPTAQPEDGAPVVEEPDAPAAEPVARPAKPAKALKEPVADNEDADPVEKPAKAPKAEKPAKPAPAERSAREEFGLDPDDFKAPARPGREASHEMVNLPAAARGFQWVRVNVGKAHGFGPREIVDLFVSGALNFPPQSVGQIKLLDDQTFAQVHSSHTKELIADMDGADFDGRPLKVSLAARSVPPKKPFGKAPERDAPPARSGPPWRDRPTGPPRSGPGGKPPWKGRKDRF